MVGELALGKLDWAHWYWKTSIEQTWLGTLVLANLIGHIGIGELALGEGSSQTRDDTLFGDLNASFVSFRNKNYSQNINDFSYVFG